VPKQHCCDIRVLVNHLLAFCELWERVHGIHEVLGVANEIRAIKLDTILAATSALVHLIHILLVLGEL
jgi:hypothetical protein